jgi:hypothetical protein
METTQFKILFEQVTTLNNHYKRINDLTGENFNIFKILKLESSEVRLHSAFLAELLNPQGNHGQKDTFLKLFVEKFCFKKNLIDTESCLVEIEKHTTSISQDFTEGGRIDIVITDKNRNQILIENKIYADDQRNQLFRYHNYSPNADLLYITLDRKEPDKNSYNSLVIDKNFKCYTYKTDILEWLEQCRKEAAIYPILRESITQYINLIKYLTNQTINDSMQTELNTMIAANLEASFLITENLNKALNDVSKEFGTKIESEFQQNGLLCKYEVNFGKKYSGFWIHKSDWKSARIGFQFQASDKGLIYGFATVDDPNILPIPFELREKLSLLPNNKNGGSDWWPWYRDFDEPYNDWRKLETWKAIIDGRMEVMIKEKVELLLKLTEGMLL